MNRAEIKEIKELDERKDPILRRKREARNLRGQGKFVERNLLTRYKKVQLPQRSKVTWKGLKEEVIIACNIHQLKKKLDKYR